MDGLQKEIVLLKNYITTLEKENEARNQQKNTLFDSIDRLTAENDRLNLLLSKNQNRAVNNPTPSNADKQEVVRLKNMNNSLTLQVSQLKRQITSYNTEIESLKSQKRNTELTIISNNEVQNLKVTISRLTTNVRQKQTEILRLTQQNTKLSKELQLFQQNTNLFTSSSTEMTLLKNEAASYRSRISQLEMLVQQNYRNSNSKIIQFQNQVRRVQADLRKKESQYTQLDSEIKKLQVQNRQLRANSKSPSQLSNLLSSKLSLEATIRQLNCKLEWSQTNIKALQNQRSVGERRIKQLQRELLETKGKLTQYKFSQESFRNVEANVLIKQKEMQAFQQMIMSLKQNKRYLQKSLKEKEEIIVNLQSQLYTLRSSNQDFQKIKNQLNDIRIIKSDYERQLASFAKANQQFQSQNSRLRLQIKNLNASIFESRSQKLFRPMSYQPQLLQEPKIIYPRQYSSNNDQDLRIKVSKLQMEVQQMKNSTNSRVFPYYEQPDASLLNQRSSIVIRQKSPMKANHSKLINEKDKQGANRGKWQNLQRKITALRSENEVLKRSLFQ